MSSLLLVKYGEISLKGQNRKYFIDTLAKNIRYALEGLHGASVRVIYGRIIVEGIDEALKDEALHRLKKVFGIVSVASSKECEAEIGQIQDLCVESLKGLGNFTFKIETNRAEKSFPIESPEISRIVGAYILKNLGQQASVDVHNPQILLNIEIRKKAYIYIQAFKGEAGLPLGTGGKGAVLLSGGIDSPVASYLMARRGMKITGLHFHSYPYTSIASQNKVVDIANELAPYTQGMDLYFINAAEFLEKSREACRESLGTILLRRFMYHVTERLKDKLNFDAVITGESLGQVASQTVEGLRATESAISNASVLRPLIAMDKDEITKLAKKIGTYSISIQPYDDCCTVFVPRHPQTKPALDVVLNEEKKLDIDALAANAIRNLEKMSLSGHIETQ